MTDISALAWTRWPGCSLTLHALSIKPSSTLNQNHNAENTGKQEGTLAVIRTNTGLFFSNGGDRKWATS